VDPKELKKIKHKLAKSDERNCKVTEVLSNSMEELVAERKDCQEMEKRLGEMEAAYAPERMQRGHNLENQELGTPPRAEPTAAAGRRTITSPRIKEEDSDL
jgi:hypothetical protein